MQRTIVVALMIIVAASLVGWFSTNPYKPKTISPDTVSENTIQYPLQKQRDGTWKVPECSVGDEVIGLYLKYRTGPPYPGAGTYDCDVYCRTKLVDVWGKAVVVDQRIGGLDYRQEGAVCEKRLRLPQEFGARALAIGLREHQKGEIVEAYLDVVPEPPDEE
ncbi:MAG: hypothetical protein BWY29_01020 [Microgenomates group bacterium ADurb.Bin238]|nr:MAG: hypothetical protein BWY29_01020 [Microgenomates group bacterium ADurb.Bin238]